MIRNLRPEKFQKYGTIVPSKENPIRRLNNHSLVLTHRETWEYQTAAETWVAGESGRTILSVSENGVLYEDFYLDKPVILSGGVYFALTAFQENASIRMAGYSLPRLLRTGQAADRFLVKPVLQVKSIYTMFYQEPPAGYRFPGGSHPMLELTYVDRGQLHSVADEENLCLHQGDMVLYGPDQWHMQYADAGQAPRFITLTFDAEGLPVETMTHRRFSSPRKAIELLQQMLAEQERMDSQSNDMMVSLLTQLLLTLQREGGPRPEKLQSQYSLVSENEIIRRATGYVSEHIREKLSVTIVAGGIQVSASYLTALFQKYLQIAPGEYIRQMKLQESKQLIRQGKMNFTEIAETLQYSTVNQFSRQFKEKYKMTPTEYAKSVRA